MLVEQKEASKDGNWEQGEKEGKEAEARHIHIMRIEWVCRNERDRGKREVGRGEVAQDIKRRGVIRRESV